VMNKYDGTFLVRDDPTGSEDISVAFAPQSGKFGNETQGAELTMGSATTVNFSLRNPIRKTVANETQGVDLTKGSLAFLYFNKSDAQ